MAGKVERRQAALVAALQAGTHDAQALARLLGVSLVTIRRDLRQLAEAGRLVRTFRGAVPWEGHEPELSPARRKHLNRAAKQAMARTAAALIRPGESLILDGGSSTAALAQQLRGRSGLRVITNSLEVMATLTAEEGIELVMLGGTVRTMSYSTGGPLAELVLRRLTADRVFLGTDGIVAGRGLCEATSAQIQLKEAMMAQAGQICVLADASKLGRPAQQAWAPLDRPWTLITDDSATDAQLAPFRALAGVEVVVAARSPAEPDPG